MTLVTPRMAARGRPSWGASFDPGGNFRFVMCRASAAMCWHRGGQGGCAEHLRCNAPCRSRRAQRRPSLAVCSDRCALHRANDDGCCLIVGVERFGLANSVVRPPYGSLSPLRAVPGHRFTQGISATDYRQHDKPIPRAQAGIDELPLWGSPVRRRSEAVR